MDHDKLYWQRTLAALEVLKTKSYVTKWDVLSDSERSELAGVPFGRPCSRCGTHLETEADFAQHFAVPDLRYINLGNCPKGMGSWATIESQGLDTDKAIGA